jgi:hypothetical protein
MCGLPQSKHQVTANSLFPLYSARWELTSVVKNPPSTREAKVASRRSTDRPTRTHTNAHKTPNRAGGREILQTIKTSLRAVLGPAAKERQACEPLYKQAINAAIHTVDKTSPSTSAKRRSGQREAYLSATQSTRRGPKTTAHKHGGPKAKTQADAARGGQARRFRHARRAIKGSPTSRMASLLRVARARTAPHTPQAGEGGNPEPSAPKTLNPDPETHSW